MITSSIGIGLAFIAMLSWGIGDFVMQKSVKKMGDWETLFFITLFGTFVLFPFVYRHIPALVMNPGNDLVILIGAGIVLIVAAICSFEGYKTGKLAVLEPIISLEIVSTALLSFFILHDIVTPLQITLIALLIGGLVLVSYRGHSFSHKIFLEKGVIIFIAGAVLMGVADFLLGWGSRVTDPLLANFVINVVMVVVSGTVLLIGGRMHHAYRDVMPSRGLVLVMSIADNIGWIAYAVAMALVPIAIATGLSESSIIISVLLGLFVNKEKLFKYQKVGLIVALVSVIVLAVVTAG
ncbi:MAG: DMT family transporter [Candidatus Taylorbacteria bacterium]